MPTIKNIYSIFTPGEAERITGVSATTQRDWRRRGFLHSKRDGWTHFEAMDLGELLVMGSLQGRGIGPSVSKEIAISAAVRILHFALSWKDAVEDQTNGKFTKQAREAGLPMGKQFVTAQVRRFLIAWANGEVSFTDDLNAAFSGTSFDAKYLGAAIILDLEALGGLLVDRAARPLVVVQYLEEDE